MDDRKRFYLMPIAEVQASLAATKTAMETLQAGGKYSGEAAYIASRGHDQRTTH